MKNYHKNTNISEPIPASPAQYNVILTGRNLKITEEFKEVNHMKRLSITLGALALIASVPCVGEMPVLADLREAGTASAQNLQPQPQVQFALGAQKKVVQQAPQGKQQVSWQPLQGKVVVQPGDVIRYIVSGKNDSDRPVKNLVVTQPIPKQTTYILNSVTVKNNAAKITYSIDNGNSFVEKPTVQVKLPNGKVETRPAPAELYTHLRWKFAQFIAPATPVNATYQVKVR
jgi:uncharacterized repeat protein (TIGR01451 family)